jgi:flagellar export protein FliJ
MPPYRLQTLMEMRERAKKEAEDAFSAAVKALKKEQDELKRLQEDLEKRRASRKAKVEAYLQEVMAKGAGINGLTMMGRYEQRLKDEELQIELEIAKQQEVVRVAERLVEQKRRDMAEAAKELKAIEKHKEKWAKEIRTERQMREELNQEEIGNTLFLMRQRK